MLNKDIIRTCNNCARHLRHLRDLCGDEEANNQCMGHILHLGEEEYKFPWERENLLK